MKEDVKGLINTWNANLKIIATMKVTKYQMLTKTKN